MYGVSGDVYKVACGHLSRRSVIERARQLFKFHVDAHLGDGVSGRHPEVYPGLQTITAGHTTSRQEGLNGLEEKLHGAVVAPVPQLVHHLHSS